MFLKILTDTIIIFLLTYSVIDILSKIISLFFKSEKTSTKTLMLLLVDEKSDVEGTIRLSALAAKYHGYELLVILSDVTEECEAIALKLSEDFSHLHVLKTPPEVISQIISDISLKDA